MLLTFSIIGYIVRRKIRYAVVLKIGRVNMGLTDSLRIFLEQLRALETELLGIGGFGMVYKGVLPSSNMQVAVKKVSHKSKQGTRGFIAEIVSLGRLRHRSLVQL